MSSDYVNIVQGVVNSDNCSGCGACALINPNIKMELSPRGFNRPVNVRRDYEATSEMVSDLRASCPGLRVASPVKRGTFSSLFSPAVSSWEAWASDDDLRHRGSSGGALTAISAWLADSGRAQRVVGARANSANPSRTVAVTIGLPEEIRGLAGSRYAPVSNLASEFSDDKNSVFIGKPCEASALRQLKENRGETELPVILSFFCAGVPSQMATDRLLAELGIPENSQLRQMRYRGHGWPGEFFAESSDGQTVSTTYEESWGKSLGPSMQWRCKICPDGVGDSADIVGGDFWHTDDNGYPVFSDGQGVSALIARTQRGHEIILDAVKAGVLQARPLDLADIVSVQPYQVDRRKTLWGRLLGRKMAGHAVPRFTQFGLFSLAIRNPVRSVRYAYGAFRRSRTVSRKKRIE